MKIIQIGLYPINPAYLNGGVETSVYGLSLELAKTNQLFIIDIPRANLREDKIEVKKNLKVYRFFSKGKTKYSSLLRLRTVLKIIRKLKPDICHLHTTGLFPFVIYLFLKHYRIPVIVTVHGLIHIEKRNLWRKRHSLLNLIKYIFSSLTEFIFLSICPILIVDTQYVAYRIECYKENWKIFRMPVCKVIPQGVLHDFFHLSSNPQKHHLLSVGAFNKRKGHLLLIDAMIKVQTFFPGFSLVIVGIINDVNYYQMMQNRITENCLNHNIRIIPYASSSIVMDLYESSEIFVLHSEEESQGIVLCEAMAAGKPIVATNSGGIPWVVENGVNGLLSDYGDIDSFADNVISLMSNCELQKKMEDNNRVKSLRYDWNDISNEITNLYIKLI